MSGNDASEAHNGFAQRVIAGAPEIILARRGRAAAKVLGSHEGCWIGGRSAAG